MLVAYGMHLDYKNSSMTFVRLTARNLRPRVLCPAPLQLSPRQNLVFLRLYSDKYSSINEFNKQKKEFSFGESINNDSDSKLDNNGAGIDNNGFDAPQLDLTNHPRLQGLRPNSAEFKYQLHLIQKEFQAEQEKQRSKWETTERFKGMAVGMVALVSIISVYTLVMNYKYLKQMYKGKYWFDIDETKIQDMNDPKGNKNSTDAKVERMAAEIGPDFIDNLRDSRTTSGIYIFGAGNSKLPSRIPGFDGKFFADVLVADDYVVAVEDCGKVYHYSSRMKEPVEILLPQKISSVVMSGGHFYYLSKRHNELFVGSKISSASTTSTGWLRSSTTYPVSTFKFTEFTRGEKVNSLAAGEDHLLVLTSKGRVFETVTSLNPKNCGQFGLPKYSPYADPEEIPVNQPYELTNLNNQIVSLKDERFVKPRAFIAVASGKYFNVALELNGNVWTWGDNTSGQCGRDVGSSTDIQQVPKLAYSSELLKNIIRYSLPDKAANGPLYVRDVYASDETAFIRLRYEDEGPAMMDQDVLVSFGNGLKGQLGVSRYIHANSSAKVLKLFLGMSEYNEESKKVTHVGVKDLSAGSDHVFVTLDNAGGKDVLVFGDNEKGQFGNGKTVKSSKPLGLPKLVEPLDFEERSEKAKRKLARKLNDQSTGGLQLLDGKLGKQNVEQVIVAGQNASAIYYRKK